MAQQNIIRQLLAGLLLLVFSFSITPKKFLHDAIANHKDQSSVASPGSPAQFSHSGFMCKCDNLVAESPFTDVIPQFHFIVFRLFAVQQALPVQQFYLPSYFFFELRGPPSTSLVLA